MEKEKSFFQLHKRVLEHIRKSRIFFWYLFVQICASGEYHQCYLLIISKCSKPLTPGEILLELSTVVCLPPSHCSAYIDGFIGR